jgi:hypothetical protein
VRTLPGTDAAIKVGALAVAGGVLYKILTRKAK